MQTVTIEKISRKDGEGAQGIWHKVGILTKEFGDKWLGCFENKYNKSKLDALAEGQTIEIVVEESGDFLNFKFPTQLDRIEERVASLEHIVTGPQVESPKDVPGNDEPDDEIPF